MRIKAKIAVNHEVGSLPRGAVIEETTKRGKALIDSGKFEETTDEVTHRAPGADARGAAGTPKADDAGKSGAGKPDGKAG